MKKILLLGGSKQQVVAIECAKQNGYYTILCDYLEDNSGQYYADKFYLASTTDKEKILEIAKKEKIDGIVAYASDPAAPTAAYVAEKLGLPTNPYESVKILTNKDLFRKFLEENNFCSPKAKSYISIENAIKEIKDFKLPVMIKPTDSSGSKGVTKVEKLEELEISLKNAFMNSKSKNVIIEEFIVQDHKYMIGGDCFLIDGKVEFWGLLNCYRNLGNNLIPIGKSYPLLQPIERIKKLKIEIQNLIDKLKLNFGAFNLEIMIDKDDNIFIIEMGPRSGGNMIPDLLLMATKINTIEATICLSAGDKYFFKKNLNKQNKNLSTYILTTNKNGRYVKVKYKKDLKIQILKEVLYKNKGEVVENFDGANKAIGIIFLEFENQDIQIEFMNNPEKWIEVVVKEESKL